MSDDGGVALAESLKIGFRALGISANAQMPPDEMPHTARFDGSFETFSPFSATGRNSSTRNVA